MKVKFLWLKLNYPHLYDFLKNAFLFVMKILNSIIGTSFSIIYKLLINRVNIYIKSKKKPRYLEIGPGKERIPGFETLNAVWTRNTDFVVDASKKLPFKDKTFDLIYASHVLEHLPWYKIENTLTEIHRILKPGGIIEIWVPDGFKLIQFMINAEEGTEIYDFPNSWFQNYVKSNAYLWANGQLLYGLNTSYPSWHKTIFTNKMLRNLLFDVGFIKVDTMENSEVRGYDHGWINLGVRAYKNEL